MTLTKTDKKRTGKKQHKLDGLHKEFIYQQLALGKYPTAICELVSEKFSISIVKQTVAQYARHTEKIKEMRELMRAQIETFFPLAMLERRLDEYTALLEESNKLDEVNMDYYVAKYSDGDTIEKIKAIQQYAQELVNTKVARAEIRMKILKQVREEVKPLRIEVEDKTPRKPINMKGIPQDKLNKMIKDLETHGVSIDG